jgi:hypothetical protein
MSNQPSQSFHHLLSHQFELLKTGNFQDLYNATHNVQHPTTETPPQSIPLFDDLKHNRAAQFAADQDNLHTAFNRIKSVTPKVTLTPRNYLSLLRKLYPPRLSYQLHSHNTRSHRPPPTTETTLTKKLLLKTLQKQKRGTAPGPFADSIDLFRDYATHKTHQHQTQFPYLSEFTTLLNHFLNNRIPPAIRSTFAAQYVIALHKDPQNLTKIHPIGIGTALRRIAAAASITIHGQTLASYLIPHGQLAINVPGGLDFIVHSTQAQLNTYTTGNNPTRALLTLDIANMFNTISRQACRHSLLQHPTLQPLIPFFDLLYHNPNECWYHTPSKNYQSFPQEEGFTQGCPLSGAFADIVLTLVLQPLNAQLQERTRNRNPSDIPPSTLSYHDDTSIVIPYPDINWFLSTFQQLGAPLGIHLNLSKTQLLTSLTPNTPQLSDTDQQHLIQALERLGQSTAHHEGLRLLGQPIGSVAFANQYIADQATKLHHIVTQQLFHRLHDHQTQLAILKHCAIPSIMHLLATHLFHTHSSNMSTDISQFDSETTLAIRITIHHAIATLTQQNTLPYHAIPIIHLPATLGGLGI